MSESIKIELVEDNETEFPHETSDANAQDAEILRETKNFPPSEPDSFSIFLSSLKEDAEIKFCVTRLADRNLSGQFRLPCNNDEFTDTLYYNGESDPTEVYSQIRKKHGGGRYRIQIREKTGFSSKSWTETISDPVEFSEKENLMRKEISEKEAKERAAHVEAAPMTQTQPATNPLDAIDTFLQQAEKMKALNSFFNPPQHTLPMADTTPAQPVTKETIKLLLLEKAIDNPNLLEQALQSVFDITPPEQEPPPQGFFASIAHAIATNSTVQNKIGDIFAGGIDLITATAGNILTAKMSPSSAVATPSATAPFDLNALRKTQDVPQDQSPPQTPSDEPETAFVIPPVKDDEMIPYVELSEE